VYIYGTGEVTHFKSGNLAGNLALQITNLYCVGGDVKHCSIHPSDNKLKCASLYWVLVANEKEREICVFRCG